MDYPIAVVDQLAPQLRSLRKARGMSQAELALKLGVTQSRITAIERNPEVVGTGQLMLLLDSLGAQLVLRDRQPSPSASEATPRTGSAAQGEW